MDGMKLLIFLSWYDMIFQSIVSLYHGSLQRNKMYALPLNTIGIHIRLRPSDWAPFNDQSRDHISLRVKEVYATCYTNGVTSCMHFLLATLIDGQFAYQMAMQSLNLVENILM